MVRFIHAADIHLDSPLRGLELYDTAPKEEIRQASRRALAALVDLAIEEQVDFVLLAGDLFDGDWKDYNPGLYFNQQLGRLQQPGIPVLLVQGNHDADSQVSRVLQLPGNVFRFPSDAPITHRLEGLRVAIHGQSYATAAQLRDLAGDYPVPLPGWLNIGLLHTSLDGRPGHAGYAPCTLSTLTGRGYDYWALGHVHKREVVTRQPWVVYPGNPQGRHIREQGAKGCLLVTVRDGTVEEPQFCPLDVMRWARLQVEATGLDLPEQVLERVRLAMEEEAAATDGRLLAVRIEVEGRCGATARLMTEREHWVAEIRSLADQVGRGQVWVEKVKLHTRTAFDLEGAKQRDDALGSLLRGLLEERPDARELKVWAEELKTLLTALPLELKQGEDGLNLEDPAQLARLADEALERLLPMLLDKGHEEGGGGTK